MKKQTKNVKLFGGPMHGQTVAVPRSAESFVIGSRAKFWTYTYAGKEGRQEQFAIQPRSRRTRRFIHWYVGKVGKDPRVEGEYTKQRPIVGSTRIAHGRGAARRKAKREHSDA